MQCWQYSETDTEAHLIDQLITDPRVAGALGQAELQHFYKYNL